MDKEKTDELHFLDVIYTTDIQELMFYQLLKVVLNAKDEVMAKKEMLFVLVNRVCKKGRDHLLDIL